MYDVCAVAYVTDLPFGMLRSLWLRPIKACSVMVSGGNNGIMIAP